MIIVIIDGEWLHICILESIVKLLLEQVVARNMAGEPSGYFLIRVVVVLVAATDAKGAVGARVRFNVEVAVSVVVS